MKIRSIIIRSIIILLLVEKKYSALILIPYFTYPTFASRALIYYLLFAYSVQLFGEMSH